jgi:hypothetical protein
MYSLRHFLAISLVLHVADQQEVAMVQEAVAQ